MDGSIRRIADQVSIQPTARRRREEQGGSGSRLNVAMLFRALSSILLTSHVAGEARGAARLGQGQGRLCPGYGNAGRHVQVGWTILDLLTATLRPAPGEEGPRPSRNE